MKKQKYSHLFREDLIDNIFCSSLLFERKSFFIIEDQSYDADLTFNSFVEEARTLRKSFENGKSIIVKNLENFDLLISEKAFQLGRHTDVHLYLTPNKDAKSFPFHCDDRDVLVHLLFGKKRFEIKKEGKILVHDLGAGDELLIPKGVEHRAISLGPSGLLSFGFVKEYYIPGAIEFNLINSDN